MSVGEYTFPRAQPHSVASGGDPCRHPDLEPRRCPPLPEAPVQPDILLRHARRGEPPLELRANAASIELADAPRAARRLRLVIDHEARHAVFDDFGYGSVAERDHWRPACHGL